MKYGLFLARIDILEKKGNRFKLIEVKAKSFNSIEDKGNPFRGRKGRIKAHWHPYLEDVAFQTMILRNVYPEAEIQPFLCLVDKAETCGTSVIFSQFQFCADDQSSCGNHFKRPRIRFVGDAEALRNEAFVKQLDVSNEVDELLPDVRMAAEEFAASQSHETLRRIDPQLEANKCKKCEYRGAAGGPSGFKECWGELAKPNPHLLDLYRVDLLGPQGSVAARMIADGRCSLFDVSEDDLRGKIGERQRVQVEWTRRDAEYLSPRLPQILAGCPFPLHFIDFEASRIAVPYHANMRPYELVAFQWSCHTIREPNSELEHKEWINIDDVYPNFAFARSLRNAIESSGTVFVWSSYEQSTLKDIRQQLIKYHVRDTELGDWLDRVTGEGAPLVDLCELAREYYFHPQMKGSLSIKDVLPAVCFADPALREHRWFATYRRECDGRVLNPYESLDPLPFEDETDGQEIEAVREGTAAIRTYQEMLYGVNRANPEFRDNYCQVLLNYCKLDTLAMVMIWMHWGDQSGVSANLKV